MFSGVLKETCNYKQLEFRVKKTYQCDVRVLRL